MEKRDNAETHDSVFNKVLELVDKENAPNYGLLLLWASQANATPVSVGMASQGLHIITCTDGILDALFHLISTSAP